MAETQYDAGTGPSIDVGSSLEGVERGPETWHDVGLRWTQNLVVEEEEPVRTIPALKRTVP